MMDDFDTLECEIQPVDTVPGDTGQTLGLLHDKNLLNLDKFDKALVKKRVEPDVICRLKTVVIMLHAKLRIIWGNHLG